MLWGTGANGKSTLLRVLQALLGEYAAVADFSTFTADRERAGGIRNDLADLQGARLVVASETSEGIRLSEAIIKSLTGRDRIKARRLYQEHFEFRPEAKFWLAVNHKPRVRDTSLGFWRRVRMIPFAVSFAGREEKRLGEVLQEELSGILNWALLGCLDWQSDGLAPPALVQEATSQYQAEEDAVGRFLAEQCVTGEGRSVSAGALYAAYREWCQTSGEYPRSQTAFGRRMAERQFQRDRHPVTRGWRYQGVGLASSRTNPA